MNIFRKAFLPVLVSGLWVNACEFLRNEILFKSYWVDHFQGLGLVFPSEPANAILWAAWGFLLASFIWVVSQRFCMPHAFLLSWTAGFFMMWMVMWNLSVLPAGLLWMAVPFSMVEVFGAVFLSKKMTR